MRDGVFWQCSKSAREGFPVCGKHGAGHASRERAGKRQNPATVNVANGDHSKPTTIKQLFAERPELRALYDDELNGDRLLDMRPQLALAKVLLRYFVDIAKLDDTDNSFGKRPPALAAVDTLNQIIAMGDKLLKIEDKLGPLSHQELNALRRGFIATINRFVPEAQREEAYFFFRSFVLRSDGPGGPGIEDNSEGANPGGPP